MNVIMKQYPVDNNSSLTAQYEALVADMTGIMGENYWDSIDDMGGYTSFTKFQPGSETDADSVGINIYKSSSSNGCTVRCWAKQSGTLRNSDSAFPSSGKIIYTAVVRTANGFMLHFSTNPMPYMGNSNSSDDSGSFGVYTAHNSVTGTSCLVSFFETYARDTIMKSSIMGPGTVSGSDSDNDKRIFYLKSATNMIATMPLCTAYSSDTPDDLLHLVFVHDSWRACVQNLTYNGQAYKRLGAILIPEEG